MKKLLFLIIIAAAAACSSDNTRNKLPATTQVIDQATVNETIESIKTSQPSADPFLLEKGVMHAASLWRSEDGTSSEFSEFAKANYTSDPAKRKIIFNKISNYIESLYGNFNEITLDLRKTLDEKVGEIDEIDRMFGNYSVSAHIQDDFYANRIAFVIALNFPYFTLAEKEKLGPEWSRDEWAMARLGDIFVSRVPAELKQSLGSALDNGGMYIAEYNIYMGQLRTADGRQIFPDDMVLLSHWNLRDELKADYADKENGPEKQEVIAKVMEHIVKQDIPEAVINSPDYEWEPFENRAD